MVIAVFGRKKIWEIKNPRRALARIERLQSQEELTEVVRRAQNKLARVAALNKITDQNQLSALAHSLGTSDDDILLRYMASLRLADPAAAQKIHSEIARAIRPYPPHEIEALGLQALRRLTEQDAILDIAARAPNKKIRSEAMLLLTGQVVLAEFVIRSQDDDAGQALPKIYLRELLDRVARRAHNPKIRAQACEMLGGHQWNGCRCHRCQATREDGHSRAAEEGTAENPAGGHTENPAMRSELATHAQTRRARCEAPT